MVWYEGKCAVFFFLEIYNSIAKQVFRFICILMEKHNFRLFPYT